MYLLTYLLTYQSMILFNVFLGENTLNVATVGNILPAQDLVNYELSDGEDEFYQPLPPQEADGNGTDLQGKSSNYTTSNYGLLPSPLLLF